MGKLGIPFDLHGLVPPGKQSGLAGSTRVMFYILYGDDRFTLKKFLDFYVVVVNRNMTEISHIPGWKDKLFSVQ